MSSEGGGPSVWIDYDDDLPPFEPPSPRGVAEAIERDRRRQREPSVVVVEDEPERRRRLPLWMTQAPAKKAVVAARKRTKNPRREEHTQPMEASPPPPPPGSRAQPFFVDDLPSPEMMNSTVFSNMLKRAALDARLEAHQRARDADEVTAKAKKLFFQYVVDTEDFGNEYEDASSYAAAEARGLYTKSVREILTSDEWRN